MESLLRDLSVPVCVCVFTAVCQTLACTHDRDTIVWLIGLSLC